MKGMVPRDKMSERARRALDLEKRRVWTVSPVTRVRESGKLYNRKSFGSADKTEELTGGDSKDENLES